MFDLFCAGATPEVALLFAFIDDRDIRGFLELFEETVEAGFRAQSLLVDDAFSQRNTRDLAMQTDQFQDALFDDILAVSDCQFDDFFLQRSRGFGNDPGTVGNDVLSTDIPNFGKPGM